jgi:uncharacterized membrane protein
MPADPVSDTGQDDLPGVERLLTLSDGVVAIALTLLVLQLKVPTLPPGTSGSYSELKKELLQGGGQITSYVISFYVIGQFWLAHHRVFRDIGGHREGLAWLNFAFLFTITVMPFTSRLLGEYGNNRLAIDIFAVNLLLAALTTQATYLFARRRGLLIRIDPVAVRTSRVRTAGLVVSVALSIGVAFFNTSLAKYCWLLMAVSPFVARRLARPGADPGVPPDGTASPVPGQHPVIPRSAET